ncbi:MAG: DUF1501 domain-containing protein, partial [Leptospira sp.]|nr:DUF1501 domain-containing protein [Leptospira sp.]
VQGAAARLAGFALPQESLEAFSFDWRKLFGSSNTTKSKGNSKSYDKYSKEIEALRIPSEIKSVVFVNMNGGMSHVDTLDPKADSVFNNASSAIRGFTVKEPFRKSAKHFGSLTAIRTTYCEDGDHDMAQHLLNTGYRTPETVGIPDLPHIGAMISYVKSNPSTNQSYFPGFITMGQRNGKIGDPGYLPIDHAGFHVSNPDKPLSNMSPSWGKYDNNRLSRRESFLDAINDEYKKQNRSANLETWDKMYVAAREFRDSSKLSAFDWEQEPETVRNEYGQSWQSKAFLLARRLVQIEVPFIQISIGGWDTHTDNKERITKIMQETDQGLAAFLQDIQRLGLWNQTLFVLSSEFGRTPEVGTRNGRDHHPRVWTTLLGGGKVSRGRVFGETDKKGIQPAPGSDAIHVRDLIASIHKYAGIDPKKKIMNTQNRPIGIGHPRSKPIEI